MNKIIYCTFNSEQQSEIKKWHKRTQVTQKQTISKNKARGDVVLESKGVVFSGQIEKLKPFAEQQPNLLMMLKLTNKSQRRVNTFSFLDNAVDF